MECPIKPGADTATLGYQSKLGFDALLERIEQQEARIQVLENIVGVNRDFVPTPGADELPQQPAPVPDADAAAAPLSS